MRTLPLAAIAALAVINSANLAAAADLQSDCVQRDQVVCTAHLVSEKDLATGKAVSIPVPGGMPPVDRVELIRTAQDGAYKGDLEVLVYFATPQGLAGTAL